MLLELLLQVTSLVTSELKMKFANVEIERYTKISFKTLPDNLTIPPFREVPKAEGVWKMGNRELKI